MTTPGLERQTRWWKTLYWRVGIGFVVFVVALLLVQSAIFIYWVDRPGAGNPRHAQLRRMVTEAAGLGDTFERGGPVDAAAVVRAGRVHVDLPRVRRRAAGRTSTSRSTRRRPRRRAWPTRWRRSNWRRRPEV